MLFLINDIIILFKHKQFILLPAFPHVIWNNILVKFSNARTLVNNGRH